MVLPCLSVCLCVCPLVHLFVRRSRFRFQTMLPIIYICLSPEPVHRLLIFPTWRLTSVQLGQTCKYFYRTITLLFPDCIAVSLQAWLLILYMHACMCAVCDLNVFICVRVLFSDFTFYLSLCSKVKLDCRKSFWLYHTFSFRTTSLKFKKATGLKMKYLM